MYENLYKSSNQHKNLENSSNIQQIWRIFHIVDIFFTSGNPAPWIFLTLKTSCQQLKYLSRMQQVLENPIFNNIQIWYQCSPSRPGDLVLSPAAGSWWHNKSIVNRINKHEFSKYIIPLFCAPQAIPEQLTWVLYLDNVGEYQF